MRSFRAVVRALVSFFLEWTLYLVSFLFMAFVVWPALALAALLILWLLESMPFVKP